MPLVDLLSFQQYPDGHVASGRVHEHQLFYFAVMHLDMACADDGWTEVTRSQRTMRGRQQVENRAVHDEWAAASRSCDELKISLKYHQSENGSEDRDEMAHAVRIHQPHRDASGGQTSIATEEVKDGKDVKSSIVTYGVTDGNFELHDGWRTVGQTGEFERRHGLTNVAKRSLQSIDTTEKHRHTFSG